MRLFDEIDRSDKGPSRHAETTFSYLNRTARIEFGRVRHELEKWLSHYPTSDQAELRARFRSNINSQHEAAFFELFLHELLTRLGCHVKLHPVRPNSSRTPDFLVEPPSGEHFYIEATLATGKTDAEVSAQARENDVYDILDRRIDSPNFFLSLTVRGSPTTPPPAKKIATFLNERLAGLDPDEITKIYEQSGPDATPHWPFEHGDWQIEFHPIPKKPGARGKTSARPIGARFSGFRWTDDRTAIRDAIIEKAGRYGELDLPYIVAVNALEIVDEIDITEALFGKEQYLVTVAEDRVSNPPQIEPSRLLDGAWTSPQGPRYTRVSGVLLATQLSSWNVPRANLRLYHNPWAKRPYQSILTRLPQAIPVGDHMHNVDGESAGTIIGLEPAWPEDGH